MKGSSGHQPCIFNKKASASYKELSDTDKELLELSRCARIWVDLDRLTEKAEDGFELCNRDKVMATAVVAALLLFRSYKWPSAVMGATLQEYERAKVEGGPSEVQILCRTAGNFGYLPNLRIIAKLKNYDHMSAGSTRAQLHNRS